MRKPAQENKKFSGGMATGQDRQSVGATSFRLLLLNFPLQNQCPLAAALANPRNIPWFVVTSKIMPSARTFDDGALAVVYVKAQL